MRRLLVIEDGHEYEEFARLFLSDRFVEIRAAHTAKEALEAMGEGADALLIDLRFERAQGEDLTGDLDDTAARLFAGDRDRAGRWLKEQQGTLILAELRRAGHGQPAVFVHDFPARRLANLKKLYGRVAAVPSFDASAILRELERLL
jgi:CheY-like chemotaxis protein